MLPHGRETTVAEAVVVTKKHKATNDLTEI